MPATRAKLALKLPASAVLRQLLKESDRLFVLVLRRRRFGRQSQSQNIVRVVSQMPFSFRQSLRQSDQLCLHDRVSRGFLRCRSHKWTHASAQPADKHEQNKQHNDIVTFRGRHRHGNHLS